jgi:hypothetical protein
MSVLLPEERGRQPWASSDLTCFRCDEPVELDGVAVVWMGTDVISLHPACARQLGAHLIADSREAELAGSTGQGHWQRRGARALRSALMTAEMRS